MEEEIVAWKHETAMDVHAASTEVNCGKDDTDKETSVKLESVEEEKEIQCAEESWHAAELKAAESTQCSTESGSCDAASTEELVAAQKEIEALESENARLKDQTNLLSQTQRAVELERLAQLQGAQERIVEKEKFEGTLMSTILELSAKQDQVNEMYTELELLRASERRLKEDLLEAESLVFSTKEEFEEIQLKLQEEVAARESVAAAFRSQVFQLQEELDKSQLLEAAAAELEQKLKSAEELHRESVAAEASAALKSLELEHHLTLVVSKYDDARAEFKEQMSELESALSQSWALRSQVEAELKEFRERCAEHESRANATLARNIELEDLVGSSLSRVSELELLSETQKSRITDLEQDREILERKSWHAETKSKEYSDMAYALSTELGNSRLATSSLEIALQAAAQRENGLEAQESELEAQVKELQDRRAEDERRANAINERNLELEELVRSFRSEVEDSNTRASELQFLLDTGKSRINDLEQAIDTLERRCWNAEAKSVQYSDMLSALTTELRAAEQKNTELEEQMSCRVEELGAKISELESALGQSLLLKSLLDAELNKINERCAEHESRANVAQERVLQLEGLVQISDSRAEDSERRASELLLLLETRESRIRDLEQEVSALTTELEKSCLAKSSLENALEAAAQNEKRLAEAVHGTTVKLHDAENLLQLLHNELIATQGKLESAGIKEMAITKKLESAEVELQQQGRVLEEDAARAKELESLIDTLTNDNALRFQELMEALKSKETELNSLQEKLHVHERQIEAYEDQAAAKVGELQRLLEWANADKEEAAQRLASSMYTITELTSQRARSSQLHYETEARLVQAQTHLHETVQELARKELQVMECSDKCSSLEEQLRSHEVMVCELSETAESRSVELERYLVKLQDQEHIIQENMSLESKLKDLQEQLSAALAEKDSAVESFKTSMQVNEDLKQELSSERQSFQSMIASIMEEKQLLYEANRDAQIELQTTKTELERELKEYKESDGALKAELLNLKLQATQNSAVQTRVKELEQLLLAAKVLLENKVENVFESAEKEEIVSLSPPSANTELGDCPDELKQDVDEKGRSIPKKASPGAPLKNIRVAVGVGLVSVIAAVLAGKH